MRIRNDRDALATLLANAGFVAAAEEAGELLARAATMTYFSPRSSSAASPVNRSPGSSGASRSAAWSVRVEPGVYVPRRQSEPLARRAVERLPGDGVAIDLCTGSGAIAKLLMAERPGARVVASDVDTRAVACAAANGVEAYRGDLFAALPRELEGRVDVVVGVVPYVPTPELPLLQRDTLTFESPLAYDGGDDGTEILRRVLVDGRRWLRRGGTLLLELGGGQAGALRADLARLGYAGVTVLVDDEEDVRGIEATLGDSS